VSRSAPSKEPAGRELQRAKPLPIRVVVVEEEADARKQILRFLRSEPAEVVGVATSGAEAVRLVERAHPDLVFLATNLPECTGFDVVEQIRAETNPVIIFIAASEEYAVRAFEVNAFDYLVKPFCRNRFHESFTRAADLLSRCRPAAEGAAAAQRSAERPQGLDRPRLEWIFVGAKGRGTVLSVADIDWIKAEDNYVRVHSGGRQYLIRERMNTLQARLDPRVFARIQRSYIVRLAFVRELRNWFGGSYVVVLHDGTELKMSRVYRDRLMEEFIGQYF
jgi:two-component system, LytTR family, response regulator